MRIKDVLSKKSYILVEDFTSTRLKMPAIFEDKMLKRMYWFSTAVVDVRRRRKPSLFDEFCLKNRK